MQKVINYYENTYSSKDVVDWYDKLSFLFASEKVLFEKLSDKIKGKKVLDIGIGGGRTTEYFSKVGCDYTGIDYMEDFAKLVAAKYKDVTIKQCDARAMTMFGDNSFDFILFSFNGIDNMDDDGRILIFKEIFRVLKPDGVFMFSTHNKDYTYFNKMPWQEKWQFKLNYLKLCLVVLKNYPKHLKMKNHEVHAADYSIINDTAHGFSVLTYYISIAKQLEQLRKLGFVNSITFDALGKECESNTEYSWMYYLSYKK